MRRSTRAELEGEGEALAPARPEVALLEEDVAAPMVLEGLGSVAAEDLIVWGPLEVEPAPATAVLLALVVAASLVSLLAAAVGDALSDEESLADPEDSLELELSVPVGEDESSPLTAEVAFAVPVTGEVTPKPPETPS